MAQVPAFSFSLFMAPLLILLCSACGVPQFPLAQKGRMDLSDQDPADFSLIALSGEWNIFWGHFIDPLSKPETLPDGSGYFTMPHSWNEWADGDTLVGGEGYASFTLDILLPEGMDELALWIPNASTAYTLYANGKEVAGSGTPGTQASTSLPHYRINTANVPVLDGKISLLLHISNFHHRRGGMWKPILMGTEKQIENLKGIEMMYDFLLLGNFLALCLYNLFLYLSSKKKPLVSILLSVFFGVLVLRVLVLGQMLITQLFENFPWVVQLKIEYLTSQAVPVLILWILDQLYPGKIDRKITLGISIFAVINTLIMLFSPILFYSKIVFVYLLGLICGLALASIQCIVNIFKGDRSAFIMIGVIVLTLLVVFGESVHNWEIILSRDFTPFGFLLTLFSKESNTYATAYLFSSILTVLVIFIIANLLALTASRKALVVHDRNQLSLDQDRLNGDFNITKRELELVHLVIEGLSNKEIGEKLFISEGTVKNHLHHIMRKLKVRNRTELSQRVRQTE